MAACARAGLAAKAAGRAFWPIRNLPLRSRRSPRSSATEAPAKAETSDGIDRTAKLYIGGKQARPDGGYSRAIWSPKGKLVGHASLANRKDLRNAVEAMNAAKGWSKTTGHLRAQILYYMAENLAARSEEFVSRINDMTGKRGGKDEVAQTLDRLFHWAAWADKHDGRAKGVPIRGIALAMNEPVGKIGAFAPDEAPLLGADQRYRPRHGNGQPDHARRL